MADGIGPLRRGARFATTQWSLVAAAGRDDDPRSADALSSLCAAYWYPVYAFVRRQGYRPEECADLTQEFFTRVLEKNYFQDADRDRGRFRTFLCAAVRHFLSNERDRARALKRGGGRAPISFEIETAEGRYSLDPPDHLTPERLFDRRWAATLLERVFIRLRDEHAAAGKAEAFERLKGFLIGDESAAPYREIAASLDTTEGAARVAVHRLRRRFRDLLTREIADTVADPSDIKAELDHLMKAASR